MIKVAIADDYKVYREGLIAGLSADENIEVMLEAENGESLLKSMENNIPDIILMDLKMPVMDGKEATRIIKEKYPSVRILVISMYDDDRFISQLTAMGADGYLLKNAAADEIISKIYAITNNSN